MKRLLPALVYFSFLFAASLAAGAPLDLDKAITAIDAQGQPITRNEGKSPVFLFTRKAKGLKVAGPAATPPVPVLTSPEANATINSIYWSQNKLREFEWKYPLYQNVKLRLRVVKINPGQTPSDAIAHNTSYLARRLTPFQAPRPQTLLLR